MKKLNFLGIGPKIAIVLLPWLAATIILSCTKHSLFMFGGDVSSVLLILGALLMVFGIGFYFSTVRLLLKGLKETRSVLVLQPIGCTERYNLETEDRRIK